MKNTYKLPWHVRQYVKTELMEYKGNKKLLSQCKGSTRALLLTQKRLEDIETVLERLNKEDLDVVKIIFFDKYTQAGAEVAKSVSKAMYYNTMNKVIYLVAKEMDLI
jgi:hypothetical protein